VLTFHFRGEAVSQIEDDAVHILIAQISRIWSQIPIHDFNWSILATEFRLMPPESNTCNHIEVHQNKPNYRVMEQAISHMLESLYDKDPSKALQMIRVLTKEIDAHIDWDHYKRDYLRDRFRPIFRLAEISLENQDIPLVALVGQPFRYIDESGLSDFFLKMAQEINIAFSTGCYTSTAFLTRKLLESLVVSVLMKEFGSTDPSKYLTKNGRTKGFESLCKEFWNAFQGSFFKRSSVREPTDLSRLRTNLDSLRDSFNIDVHQLGGFKKSNDLMDVRNDIQGLVYFLWNLYNNIK